MVGYSYTVGTAGMIMQGQNTTLITNLDMATECRRAALFNRIDCPVLLPELLSQLSSVLLVIAISALGVHTSMKDITSIGWRPIALVVIETVFIAMVVVGLIYVLM